MNNKIPAFKSSNLVIGDAINGFSAITADKICFGQRPIGPLGKAIVSSRQPSVFTGLLYRIYTESFTPDREDSDSMFDACILGDTYIFKLNPTCGDPKTFSISRVTSARLSPGDLMLSFPSYIPLAEKLSVNVSVEDEISRGMVLRVSAISEKKLINAPAIALAFTGNGVILDGLAVTSFPNQEETPAVLQ